MFQFLINPLELEKFFNLVLPDLTQEEVYFLSLSARNKYLTEEEREIYSCGRTEMFERKIIREHDWMKFLRTIKKYECSDGAYTGRTGLTLPEKCLILYININPCNMVRAYKLFQDEMNENILNLITKSGSGLDFFKHMDRLMMNAIQKSKGTRHYIDIDIDAKDITNTEFWEAIKGIAGKFKENGLKFFVIKTKGGVHFLLKRRTINFNYTLVIKEYNHPEESNPIKEIKRNNNDMIPLPGTSQAGYPVEVYYELSNF